MNKEKDEEFTQTRHGSHRSGKAPRVNDRSGFRAMNIELGFEEATGHIGRMLASSSEVT